MIRDLADRYAKTVELMTNKERNQWAKDGYKGALERDYNGPAKYITNYEVRFTNKYGGL